MNTIGLIDCIGGNTGSVGFALDRLGMPWRPVRADQLLNDVDVLLLPGVGHFATAMERLQVSGWSERLRTWVQEGRRLAGICVGLQVLFEGSDEEPLIPGLDLIPGRIRRLQEPALPVMGWAQVQSRVPSFPAGVGYFVHSFGLPAADSQGAVAVSGDIPYAAAVQSGSIRACQFHPEKSGAYGEALLKGWLLS